MAPKSIEDTARFASMVADKQGWALNADEEFRAGLVEGLSTNWNRYGYFLCPCRDSEGAKALDADLICPCKYSWADIEEFGHCFCALYLSRSFAATGKAPASIPDRKFAT
jgi:ferredoxin-thioredoxin reductase catalytic subunit